MSRFHINFWGLLFVLVTLISISLADPIQPRIINGQDVNETDLDFPYYAYVTAQRPGLEGYGGGFWVTGRHVVTSARFIVSFTNWTVWYDSNQFESLKGLSVSSAVAHEDYDSAYAENDIGLLTIPYQVPCECITDCVTNLIY